jgi:D-alanyl-D-alanine carboxypeptidase
MSQLPLSDSVNASFPKLHSSCFIIVSKDTDLVVHEKNSCRSINTGTFDDLVRLKVDDVHEFARQVGAKDTVFIESTNSSAGESKSTLYDMCLMCAQLKLSDTRLFKSAMSGIGCTFSFRNKNACEFICVLYGASSESALLQDRQRIEAWLEQFFVFDAAQKNGSTSQIPVLYGVEPNIPFRYDKEKHLLLLSKKYPGQVHKVSRYRTVLRAPVAKGDELGIVMYQTNIFKNPIPKIIKAQYPVKAISPLKRIFASFKYIVFGTTEGRKRER